MSEENRMIVLAKKCMLEYMSDYKVRMPSDFDEDFLGGVDITGTFGITAMAWNKTPFYTALGELIKEDKIKWWLDGEGNYCYQFV